MAPSSHTGRKAFPFAVLDAFAPGPFGGNPAAVFVLEPDHGLSDDQFQLIAREFNLSETAFVVPLEDHSPSEPHYSLRWFTPAIEVPLCGHATLAAAAHLFSVQSLSSSAIKFASRWKGQLLASRVPNPSSPSSSSSAGERFELDFPETELEAVTLDEVPDFGKGWKGGKVVRGVKGGGGRWWLVEVETDDLASLEPDITVLHSLLDERVLIVTAKAGPSDTWAAVHSRIFAPGSGIPEDPVTGSAHTLLAPYWLGGLSADGRKEGEKVINCRQVSKRGGELEVEWVRETKRCLIRGSVTVMSSGTFFV